MKVRSSLELASANSHFLQYLLRFLALHLQLNDQEFNELTCMVKVTTDDSICNVNLHTILLYEWAWSIFTKYNLHTISWALSGQKIARYRFKESGQAPLPPILCFGKQKKFFNFNYRTTSSREVAKQKVAANSMLIFKASLFTICI